MRVYLANLQQSIMGSQQRLIEELRILRNVGLAEFLEQTSRKLGDVCHAGGWTVLHRLSGYLQPGTDNEAVKETLRCAGALRSLGEDYPISRSPFPWQSQSATSEETQAGRRYIVQRANGRTFLLFVRPTIDDPYIALDAFTCHIGAARRCQSCGSLSTRSRRACSRIMRPCLQPDPRWTRQEVHVMCLSMSCTVSYASRWMIS